MLYYDSATYQVYYLAARRHTLRFAEELRDWNLDRVLVPGRSARYVNVHDPSVTEDVVISEETAREFQDMSLEDLCACEDRYNTPEIFRKGISRLAFCVECGKAADQKAAHIRNPASRNGAPLTNLRLLRPNTVSASLVEDDEYEDDLL